MSGKPKPTEIEIDLTKGKVKVTGIYEDLRPLIKTSVDGINHVLKVAENLIGLPADYVNHHLSRFRDRYRIGMSQIPEQHRELPPFRLICVTMREASYSAEEPELQELFAQLLIAGSDERTQGKAFPGFASTIGQLSSHDAVMLRQLRDNNWRISMHDFQRVHDGESDITEIVFYNLRRLGLVDWWHIEPSPFFASTVSSDFARRVAADSSSPSFDGFGVKLDLERGLRRATEELSREIVRVVENTQQPFGIKITPYGQLFVETCLGQTQSDGSV